MSKAIVLAAAVVATATAFSPNAAFKPALRQGASALSMALDRSSNAPLIQIFDHRGCSRVPKEYTGAKTNGPDDEMMVKVSLTKVAASESAAAAVLQQTVGNLIKK